MKALKQKNIFIILGYGIPEDILRDGNYNRYLALIFNTIYQICQDKKDQRPIIIFSGGQTDIYKPYQRTESKEMNKLFLKYATRQFVKFYTKGWRYQTENQALITLENLFNSFKIASKIKGNKFYYIFVEKTREARTKILAKKIMAKNFQIISLDFDLSSNRYREQKFILEKEKLDLKLQLKALGNKKFHQELRKILKERLKFFRQAGPQKHGQAIYEWWQKTLRELENK